jgi:hypothetical protein
MLPRRSNACRSKAFIPPILEIRGLGSEGVSAWREINRHGPERFAFLDLGSSLNNPRVPGILWPEGTAV